MKNPLDWIVLKSEYIYKDNWFTARKDTCRKPDGGIVDPYYVLEYPDWAAALAITAEGKVILVKQYRHAYGKTLIEIPGGVIDDTDASPEAAIARELLEETGYQFNSIQRVGMVSANPSTNTNTMYMFLATGGVKVGEQVLDANEEIELHFKSLEEVKAMLRNNDFLQSMHVACIFYGLQQLGEL